MWMVFQNIMSVARYESKLLVRSWFFKLFGLLVLTVMFVYNFVQLTDTSVYP